MQITISRNDQHRIVSQKAEKGSQQLLREKYEDGDSEVGLLGESSGKFEYYVNYSKPSSYHHHPIKPTGWDLEKPRVRPDAHSPIKHVERTN